MQVVMGTMILNPESLDSIDKLQAKEIWNVCGWHSAQVLHPALANILQLLK